MEPGPQFADIGRLLRRGVRGAVAAARAADRETLSAALWRHLGPDAGTFEIVEEA